MIDGINDTDLDADALADLLRGDHAHVNLIPMNQVAHTPWTGSPIPVIERFAGRLRAAGIDDDDPHQPRHGDRRGLRPAGRRACRRARADRRPPAPRASRRRERDGPARRASHEPVPAGVGERERREREAGARGRADRRQHPRQRPRGAGRRDPPGRGRRRGPDPPRRDGRPLRPQHHVRLEDHRGCPAGDPPAVRRPPDDQRARALDATRSSTPAATRSRSTSRSTSRRSGRRSSGSARRAARPGCRSSRRPRWPPRRLPRPARHHPGDDRRARVRRPVVHGATSRGEAGPARDRLDPAGACEVQVDGGGRAETAEVIGAAAPT